MCCNYFSGTVRELGVEFDWLGSQEDPGRWICSQLQDCMMITGTLLISKVGIGKYKFTHRFYLVIWSLQLQHCYTTIFLLRSGNIHEIWEHPDEKAFWQMCFHM